MTRRRALIAGIALWASLGALAAGQSVFDIVPSSPSGTFVSTVTMPDSSTWGSDGVRLSPSTQFTAPDTATWISSGLSFPTSSRLLFPDLSVLNSTGLTIAASSTLRGPDASIWNQTGFSVGAGKQFSLANGSAVAPALSFGAEATTGLFRAGSQDLRLSLGGSEALRTHMNVSPTVSVAVGNSATFATVGGVICVNTTDQATTTLALEVLATCNIVGNALARDHQMIRVKAWATTAANGNSKQFGIYLGATHCGQFVGNLNDGLIIAEATIIRLSATTQECIGSAFGQGAAGDDHNLTFGTPAETLTTSATILAKGTGGAALGDVTFEGMYVEVMN